VGRAGVVVVMRIHPEAIEAKGLGGSDEHVDRRAAVIAVASVALDCEVYVFNYRNRLSVHPALLGCDDTPSAVGAPPTGRSGWTPACPGTPRAWPCPTRRHATPVAGRGTRRRTSGPARPSCTAARAGR